MDRFLGGVAVKRRHNAPNFATKELGISLAILLASCTASEAEHAIDDDEARGAALEFVALLSAGETRRATEAMLLPDGVTAEKSAAERADLAGSIALGIEHFGSPARARLVANSPPVYELVHRRRDPLKHSLV